MSELYPLLFEPTYKDYVWGGQNLVHYLDHEVPAGKIAESWEIAAHPDGQSTVSNGHLAGLTLGEVHRRLGLALIGHHASWAQERERFPLLVKVLDAQDRLSVQVHPSDAYAARHEDGELGKTEMWVILDASDEAAVILGLSRATTRSQFVSAVKSNELNDYLHQVPVKAGDFLCVPSGSLHAILGGAIIAEIQQSSNVTYRVYDWGRNEPDRPLHLEKAADVIDFEQIQPGIGQPSPLMAGAGLDRERLCHNQYFVVERWRLPPQAVYQGYNDGSTMEIWAPLAGSVTINSTTVDPIRFALLPAALGPFTVSTSDMCLALRAYLPPPA